MSRRSLRECRAVLTGASSGIGRALALELARHRVGMVISARRAERLNGLAAEVARRGGMAYPVAGDITDPAARDEILDTARRHFDGLDLLINNAGVGAIGEFAEASPGRLRRIMEVNFFAPVELIRAGLPMLRRGDRPMIVNVGSVLGHRAVPKKSEYCASKFALHGFSDALRAELAPHKIDVLIVSPSTTRSEFFENVIENRGSLPWLAAGAMPAEEVARQAVSAMRAGRHEVILTPGGKALVWLDRLAPALVDMLVARYG